MAKFLTQAINDEILEKLSLENRYNFLNTCVKPMLSSDEMSFLKQVEDFCVNYEKTKNLRSSLVTSNSSYRPSRFANSADFSLDSYIRYCAAATHASDVQPRISSPSMAPLSLKKSIIKSGPTSHYSHSIHS